MYSFVVVVYVVVYTAAAAAALRWLFGPFFIFFFFVSRKEGAGNDGGGVVSLSLSSSSSMSFCGFWWCCVDQKGLVLFLRNAYFFLFSRSSLFRLKICFLTSIPRRLCRIAYNDAIAKRERKENDERNDFFVREEKGQRIDTQTGRSDEKKVVSFSSTIRYIYIHTRMCLVGEKNNKAKVVEPATKISFDERTSDGLALLGVGARVSKVAFLNVKVYAVAMYADEKKLHSDLLEGDFEKEIVITLNVGVGIKDFITKGLKEALIPRISRIAANSATKEKVALEEMELIRAGLYGKKKRKLEKGTTMRFALKESGGDVAMVMESSGVETTFKSDVLAKALLDVYVGDDPVSVGAKKAFEAGFYEYINTHI